MYLTHTGTRSSVICESTCQGGEDLWSVSLFGKHKVSEVIFLFYSFIEI